MPQGDDDVRRRQCLYRDARGLYWLQDWVNWDTPIPYGNWLLSNQAADWLVHNGHQIPRGLAEQVSPETQRTQEHTESHTQAPVEMVSGGTWEPWS